jgi:hypothetical protein
VFVLNHDHLKITRADLDSLIGDGVPESKSIEYKRTVLSSDKSNTNEDKIKLLAGISSFANTDGGDLLIGMRAEDGIPKEITPIERVRLDGLKLTIEQLIQNGITPRLLPLIHEIPVSEKESVLLVRVPRSWAAPHRVTLAGNNNFFARHSSGKYHMDVNQLRAAFTLDGVVHERIHELRAKRVNEIMERLQYPAMALHLIPYESLDPTRVFDLRAVSPEGLHPLGQTGYRDRIYNFDGVKASTVHPFLATASQEIAYTQIFRNGTIESVNSLLQPYAVGLLTPGDQIIYGQIVAKDWLQAFQRFLNVQESIGVAPPIMVLISLVGVYEHYFDGSSSDGRGYPRNALRKITILIPGSVVDSYDCDPGSVFRPMFDILWNAGGLSHCTLYGSDGRLNDNILRLLNTSP